MRQIYIQKDSPDQDGLLLYPRQPNSTNTSDNIWVTRESYESLEYIETVPSYPIFNYFKSYCGINASFMMDVVTKVKEFGFHDNVSMILIDAIRLHDSEGTFTLDKKYIEDLLNVYFDTFKTASSRFEAFLGNPNIDHYEAAKIEFQSHWWLHSMVDTLPTNVEYKPLSELSNPEQFTLDDREPVTVGSWAANSPTPFPDNGSSEGDGVFNYPSGLNITLGLDANRHSNLQPQPIVNMVNSESPISAESLVVDLAGNDGEQQGEPSLTESDLFDRNSFEDGHETPVHSDQNIQPSASEAADAISALEREDLKFTTEAADLNLGFGETQSTEPQGENIQEEVIEEVIQEGNLQEEVIQEETTQEETIQEGATQEETIQEDVIQEETIQEESSQEPQGEAIREESLQDDSQQQEILQDGNNQEEVIQGDSSLDGSSSVDKNNPVEPDSAPSNIEDSGSSNENESDKEYRSAPDSEYFMEQIKIKSPSEGSKGPSSVELTDEERSEFETEKLKSEGSSSQEETQEVRAVVEETEPTVKKPVSIKVIKAPRLMRKSMFARDEETQDLSQKVAEIVEKTVKELLPKNPEINQSIESVIQKLDELKNTVSPAIEKGLQASNEKFTEVSNRFFESFDSHFTQLKSSLTETQPKPVLKEMVYEEGRPVDNSREIAATSEEPSQEEIAAITPVIPHSEIKDNSSLIDKKEWSQPTLSDIDPSKVFVVTDLSSLSAQQSNKKLKYRVTEDFAGARYNHNNNN